MLELVKERENFLRAPKTKVGEFKRNITHMKEHEIPPELLDLFYWLKQIKTKEIDYIMELKNLYQVTQQAMIPALIEKLTEGKPLTKQEISTLKQLLS